MLVLAGSAGAGAGRMAPPTSTRISARMKCVQEHGSRVNIRCAAGASAGTRVVLIPGTTLAYKGECDYVFHCIRDAEVRSAPYVLNSEA